MRAPFQQAAPWFVQRGPGILQAASALALAAGIGLWGALLLAPRPAPVPPALAAADTQGHGVDSVIGWFGGGSARLRLTIVGLIASGRDGAALLSINGAPPRAYHVGQTLVPGVILSDVLPGAITIEQDGLAEHIAMPRQHAPIEGFVPADAGTIKPHSN